MKWRTLWTKAWRGLVAVIVTAAIAYVISFTTDLLNNPACPVILAAMAPTFLHLLGLLNNWWKHKDWPVAPAE